MAVRIAVNSRLLFGELVLANGVEFWDVLDLPEIPEQQDDLQLQVSGGVGERLDRLATRYYGDPNLWWVIAVANGLEVNPADLNEGDFIRIPSPRFVLQELQGLA